MEQIDEQALSAHPLQGLCRRILSGQQAFLFGIERPAQHRTQQKIAQVWKQGEIVRGGKAIGGKTQNGQPGEGKPDRPQPQPQDDHGKGHNGQQGAVGPPEQGPEHHAAAQALQNAEVNNDILPGKAQKIHAHRGSRAQKAAAEHQQPPLHRAAAQDCADAGDQQENGAVIVLEQLIPTGVPVPEAVELHHIIVQVNEHHADQRQPPGSVQLPDALFHFAPTLALASSSSTR